MALKNELNDQVNLAAIESPTRIRRKSHSNITNNNFLMGDGSNTARTVVFGGLLGPVTLQAMGAPSVNGVIGQIVEPDSNLIEVQSSPINNEKAAITDERNRMIGGNEDVTNELSL